MLIEVSPFVYIDASRVASITATETSSGGNKIIIQCGRDTITLSGECDDSKTTEKIKRLVELVNKALETTS